jgi:hypothetical protein
MMRRRRKHYFRIMRCVGSLCEGIEIQSNVRKEERSFFFSLGLRNHNVAR